MGRISERNFQATNPDAAERASQPVSSVDAAKKAPLEGGPTNPGRRRVLKAGAAFAAAAALDVFFPSSLSQAAKKVTSLPSDAALAITGGAAVMEKLPTSPDKAANMIADISTGVIDQLESVTSESFSDRLRRAAQMIEPRKAEAASSIDTNFAALPKKMQDLWNETDEDPLSRPEYDTYIWGPKSVKDKDGNDVQNFFVRYEPYAEAPGGVREVAYFDKSRMEETNPGGDQSSEWFITNGLLGKELITGSLQLGDTKFEQHSPAQINVAGDLNVKGVTFATFNNIDKDTGNTFLAPAVELEPGTSITHTILPDGTVIEGPGPGGVQIGGDYVPETGHNLAQPFWDFINSSRSDGQKLFSNPFYATGYPLTEPYWTKTIVGGVEKDVLVQVFERRVLTYTPSNSDAFKVEMGNIGRQYYQWRYGKTPSVDDGETPQQLEPNITIPGLTIDNSGSDILGITVSSIAELTRAKNICAPNGNFIFHVVDDSKNVDGHDPNAFTWGLNLGTLSEFGGMTDIINQHVSFAAYQKDGAWNVWFNPPVVTTTDPDQRALEVFELNQWLLTLQVVLFMARNINLSQALPLSIGNELNTDMDDQLCRINYKT